MKNLFYLSTAVMILASCNSENSQNKVKESEGTVVQAVQNDTLITVYDGVKPCKGCKQINTEITFVRSLKDTQGRFALNEVYLNKKDSAFQKYAGIGNYKILPAPNGDVKGVALYNMVLDDQSKGYLYLLEDSLTLVRADEKGKPVNGDDAVVLKRSK
jgi:hypothetical protein